MYVQCTNFYKAPFHRWNTKVAKGYEKINGEVIEHKHPFGYSDNDSRAKKVRSKKIYYSMIKLNSELSRKKNRNKAHFVHVLQIGLVKKKNFQIKFNEAKKNHSFFRKNLTF